MPPTTPVAATPVSHLSRLTAGACALLAVVLLWRLPLLFHEAEYLGLVSVGVALGALVAVARLLTGHGDGRVLALTVVGMTGVGQLLNLVAGLPGASDLQGRVGWATVAALVAEVAIVVLVVREVAPRAPRPRTTR